MNRCLAVLASIVLLSGSVAWAQDAPPRSGGEQRFGRSRGPITEEDRQPAIEFARINMPNLHILLDEIPTDDPRYNRLMAVAVRRYRMSRGPGRDHPEMHEAMLQRIQQEDELFGLVRKLDRAPEDEKSAIRQEMREQVRQIVQGWVEERRQRIENLKRQLEREQEQLQRDRQEIDKLADRHMRMFLGGMTDPPFAASDEPPHDSFGPSTAPSDGARRQQRK
jgi:hypothetical protein